MLNKELLMIQTELTPVTVTLQFFGGDNLGTYYTWTSPDGTSRADIAFDEKEDVIRTFTCKPNTMVNITTQVYSGGYTATPPQDITVVEEPTEYQMINYQLTFKAFRDVVVDF